MRLSVADDEHRPVGVPRNAVRVRSDEVVLELGPLRGDDDEVAVDAFGGVENLLVDRAVGDDVPHRHLGRHVLRRELSEAAFGLLDRLFREVLGKELTVIP